MDTLTLRILDLLADDEEQLEELYIDINYRRRDYVLYFYREQFRLSEVILCLTRLEVAGLITSVATRDFPEECGPAGRTYRITEAGRVECQSHTDRFVSLYELRES